MESRLPAALDFRHQPRMNRRSALLMLILASLAACERQNAGVLRFGMDMSYPPFEMRDTQGRPAGVSVDLARALGEHLGRPVAFENMPFDGLIPALKTGRIDLVVSSMTATEERSQSVDFSEPYLRTGLCLLTAAGSSIQGIAELDQPGRKVAVVRGTTGHLWAKEHLHSAEVLALAKETSCVLEVTQAKADAFIYDQMSTLRNWQANPDTTRALLNPFREEQWAIALRKGDSGLREKVNAFLATYRADSGFTRLGDKWLREQKAAFARLGVPFVF
jgi:polar amino acid transport system substrate-binding protein